jgi:hypothetical protein
MAWLAWLVHPLVPRRQSRAPPSAALHEPLQKSACDAGLRVLEQPGQVMRHLLLPLADVSELLLDLLEQTDNPLIGRGFLALSHRHLLIRFNESSLRPTSEPVLDRSDARARYGSGAEALARALRTARHDVAGESASNRSLGHSAPGAKCRRT